MRKTLSNINLGIAAFCICLVTYTLTIGRDQYRQTILAEVFGGQEAFVFQKKTELARILPHLFTDEFYQLRESAQLKRADVFWRERMAPIAKHLTPHEQATQKEQLFEAIRRMNQVSTSPQEQPALK